MDPVDPGAARYGNFINYYEFNSTENRLQCIPKELLYQLKFPGKINSNIIALDIGCNAGNLTVAIYKHFTEDQVPEIPFHLHMLGIDIDPVLILRANEANPNPKNISFCHMDFMSDYLRDNHLQTYLKQFNKRTFDLICAFSVSMWIHLNHGDDGLRIFLQEVAKSCKYLLIEPQSWKSYQSAIRRMKRLNREPFEKATDIKLKSNVIEEIDNILLNCGMKQIKTFDKTQWGRKIILYSNNNNLAFES